MATRGRTEKTAGRKRSSGHAPAGRSLPRAKAKGTGTGSGKTTGARIVRILKTRGPEVRALAQALRAFVRRQVPGVIESINPWGIPTFNYHGELAYFMVHAAHVTFGFQRGAALPDPQGLLEGTGKSMRHVKIRTLEDLERPGLRELVKSAARLNREESQQGMKGRT